MDCDRCCLLCRSRAEIRRFLGFIIVVGCRLSHLEYYTAMSKLPEMFSKSAVRGTGRELKAMRRPTPGSCIL